MNEHQQSGVLS